LKHFQSAAALTELLTAGKKKDIFFGASVSLGQNGLRRAQVKFGGCNNA